MNNKKFLYLLKTAKNKGIVDLENGYHIVTKSWLEKNIEPADLDEDSLMIKLEDYSWNVIDASYIVEYFKVSKENNFPKFYVIDKDNYIWCDSQNIDMAYCIKEDTKTRCYVITYYSGQELYIKDLGYMALKDAKKLYNKYHQKYDDVAIYTLLDDTSIDADNIDWDAWYIE